MRQMEKGEKTFVFFLVGLGALLSIHLVDGYRYNKDICQKAHQDSCSYSIFEETCNCKGGVYPANDIVVMHTNTNDGTFVFALPELNISEVLAE